MNTETEQKNKEILQRNNQLSKEYVKKKEQLDGISQTIDAQQIILSQLTKTSNKMQAEAEERAQEVYNSRLAELDIQFDEQNKLLQQRIKIEEDKLSDLEAKQLAYIQAQQRAEEIQAKQDYYRLVLTEQDIEEIKMLRQLQSHFSRKEAIDKLIWETYYKAPYDILMSHLFDNQSKISGIYKITNMQNGQSYIGQSINCRERTRQHIKAALSNSSSTNKLYQQMKQYGPENFTFEILETVNRAKLNEREAYWIDFYKTKDYGLNSTKGNS